jgi:hypothetical protein
LLSVFHRLLLALGLACGLVAAETASAAGTTPVRILVEVPEGCSSPRAFFDAVRSRINRIHWSAKPGEGLELRVSVTEVQNKVRGELRVIDATGAASTRTVDGSSCEEVIHALSLTAALVVDQIAPPEAKPSRPDDASSDGSATAGDVAPLPPKRDDGQTSDRGRPAGDADEPAVVPPEAAEPQIVEEPATDEEDLSPEKERADPPGQSGIQVGIGPEGLVAEIISPRLSVGGALFLDLSSTSEHVFSPSLGLAIAHVPAEFAQSTGDVSIRWTAALLTACPLTFRAGNSFAIRPCALGIGGQVEARGESTEFSATAMRSWWSAGALGRLNIAIGGSASLRFELGLSVPLARRRFITTPPVKTVGVSPSISTIAGLGVAYVF